MQLQKTVKRSIYFEGRGLHTGEEVGMWIHPAEPNHGIIFKRIDVDSPPIPANIKNVVDSRFATVLGVNGTLIWTVEHVLAALNGMGIDNAFIELKGPEVPAMDGSARDFAEGIKDAGIHSYNIPRACIIPDETFSLRDDGRRISIIPASTFEIDYTINFANPIVGHQHLRIDLTPESFIKEIAPARTFGFLEEVNKLKEMNLAKGGGLENAIVVGEFGIINEGGLRFSDEFVRHKILDLIGDFALSGAHIAGRVVAEKGGHMLNHLLVKQLLRHQPNRLKANAQINYLGIQPV
jgi:UDP-3-O-[3-hydroxymyristoyl] N-acetylglucosamine deacetylase